MAAQVNQVELTPDFVARRLASQLEELGAARPDSGEVFQATRNDALIALAAGSIRKGDAPVFVVVFRGNYNILLREPAPDEKLLARGSAPPSAAVTFIVDRENGDILDFGLTATKPALADRLGQPIEVSTRS